VKKPGKEKNRMTTKSFQKLMEKRLTKLEITEIENQAMLEARALKSLQNDITNAMNNYMKEKKIGFNELVKRLDVSPAHIAKIKRGAANLTIASIARLFALLGQEPHLVFNKK
jgi:transcriptional regulator with XRE-family HTH domain